MRRLALSLLFGLGCFCLFAESVSPASELVVIAGMAIEKGMKAEELKAIVFPHPTVGEILKEAL